MPFDLRTQPAAKSTTAFFCEWVSPELRCQNCEEGAIWKSRFGGNDPDVWRDGDCEKCDGAGHRLCDQRGCANTAVMAWDRDAYCADHSMAPAEIIIELFGEA